jgi:glycosyltransferase involved in cell wall biosynthesis
MVAMEQVVAIVQKEVVLHYRVSFYNYLNRRLAETGLRLVVIAESIEPANPHPVSFDLILTRLDSVVLLRRLAALRPSVVVAFLSLRDVAIWPLLLYGRAVGLPVVNWGHAIDHSKPTHFVRRWLYGLLNELSAGILLYSEPEKRLLYRRHLRKAYVANNTLNFADMPAIPQTKEELKASWHIGSQRVVLYVGRIQPRKRIEHLIEAFELPRFSAHGLVIAGPGMPQGLVERVRQRHNIRYLGAVYDPRQVNELFKLADLFCIPGAVGLGVVQAFYWGLPLITEMARHGPEIHFLRDGVNGIMVRGKADLTRALWQLLQDSETRERYSANARSTILVEGDIRVMAQGFCQAVACCLGIVSSVSHDQCVGRRCT